MSDAIPFVYRRLRTMADGTVRMEIDIEPGYALDTMTLFNEPNLPGIIARMTSEVAQTQLQQEQSRPYSKEAQLLRQSGFFRIPEVWERVGSDKQFLAWIKEQSCAFRNKKFGYCSGDIVAAHVRRVANGAGTGIKPPYSSIPCCDNHHQMQHQSGEMGGPDHWNMLRIHYLEKWSWETLKRYLGFDHWYNMDPDIFIEWAKGRNLYKYLPYEIQSKSGLQSEKHS